MAEQDPTHEMPGDPSINSHKPASGISQDISHILLSIFKDVCTNDMIDKNTLSNLVKTKTGQDSYNENYIEELQQAHSKYEQRMKEADMLENHIIKARAQATAKERHNYERITENIDVSDHQDLFTVKSAFSWCVDEDLLRRNHLISPGDYLITQKPQVKAPAAVKSSLTKPTIAHVMHTCGELQDEGHLKKTVLEINELDDSVTFESSSGLLFKRSGTPKQKTGPMKHKPKWMDEPSAKDRAEAWENLQRLKRRNNYLQNPRFLSLNAHQGGTSLIRPKVKNKHERKRIEDQSSSDDPVPIFLAKPSVIVFTDYIVGHVYESTLELKNMTSTSRHVRVIPPTTPFFSIGLGRFPSDGGVVAPGMSCKYTLRFAPDSLGDYKDFLKVETQSEHPLVVPIEAQRPPPILTLPRVLDCGYCLVGGVTFLEFLCQNVGRSPGTFYILPKDQWPALNLRSVPRTYFSEQPPFAVGPTLFVLQPGEATVLEVGFFPTAAERSRQIFTIICDNCQVKDISIEGEGQLLALELVSVSGEDQCYPVLGEVHDLTAEHCVCFSPCNPQSVQQKKLVIRNNVHLELPFHWRIMKPNLHPLLPGETPESTQIQFRPVTDDVFHISPTSGLLAPCQDQEFILTFCPKELKDYHSVCHLDLMDVPQLPPESSENSFLQPVQTGSKLISVNVMGIEVKGSAEPYQMLLEPYAVVIPGEILICTTTRRQFKMWNHSKTFILFQWERLKNSCHIIEVEPSAGRIEENECFDFSLIVTGGKPERVETSLVCNIQHHHQPIVLAVEVTFKGPAVSLGVPSVDFGLIRFGEQAQTTLLLTNTSQMEASWILEEKLQGNQDTQLFMEPCSGLLPPLASCDVKLIFRPRLCQQFETELKLSVENGTGCHVWVGADVQSPQVCLLNSSLVLSDLYVGVPATGSVTLFNQTLLPSCFSWMTELQGKQAALCTVTFDPSSGILGPNETLEITVNLTSHADTELTEVAAVCEIQGMKSPLVLTFISSKPNKLCVSYSLPGVSPSQDNTSVLVLDFGEDVVLKKAVTKQLLITNQTAIPASFAIEAEYFTCRVSEPNNQSEKRFTDLMNPHHLFQAKKAEAKAHEEFMSRLLAHGKGAAFQAVPDSGLLGPFETQTVDVTAYAEMWGEYRDHLICKVGDLEPMCVLMQMTMKGCPLYFQMTGPRADDQHQGPTIHFGSHVSGTDTVSRSVRINNPTTFDIRMDWETYNIDQNDSKLVDMVVAYGDHFPLKDVDGNEVLRGTRRFSKRDVTTTRERTHTPASRGTSDFTQSVTDVEEEEFVSEEEESAVKTDLISVHIRPHLGNLSDYPYCITPQQIVIPAKSSGTIHVSFTPLTLSGSDGESRCSSLALGFMSLDSEVAVCVPGKVRRAQGLDLEPVRMDLQAAVKPAVLLVQMDEDDGLLEFNASAGDLLRAESDEKIVVHEFGVTRTLNLINPTEMTLQFKLETLLPFSVLKPELRSRISSTSSNPSSSDSQTLVLRPRRSLQVKVAFHCSLPLLDYEDQTEEGVSSGVRLIRTTSGQKKLRFQRNLVIHHSNNSLQTVPLCAHLDLLTLSLSSDSVSFGFCYVGQTETREINLHSLGTHTYWESSTESVEGDACVFTVTPDSGLLRSKKPHVNTCSQCLQISFTPSADREFKAVVVFRSPLLKTRLTLQLQGSGSFEKEYRSKYSSL